MTGRPPIAIVGLAGAFAQSKDLAEYWSNILHEVDCITDVPATHWSIDDYYDPDPKAPDKTYCKRGGFLPELEFNPLEFGLPPNILELTDVSQLLALVVAKRALADAGYGDENPHATRTGVVLGVSALKLITPLVTRLQYPVWKRVLRNSGIAEADTDAIVETIKRAYVEWREDAFPGYLSNVVAGRIANRLDLGGINCSVDAACASSMASLQFAVQELRSGNCDVMLAGGVDTNNSVMGFVSFSKTPAFTPHDRMRPFDEASDGMLIGEGLGMLVLRRLDEAERDGQRVYAVIKGIGASSDGRFKSIYAPRQEGQELALRRAYEEAGCAPSTVGLIEAHGTGTPTGDPAELSALHRVLADETVQPQQVALGSVKSQIGHTKVAAGAASLIKAALALHDKVLPPTINVEAPHPAVGGHESPFYLNTRARPWFSQTPRRAGVSSFGFGGTNFHVVLEEHTPAKPDTIRRLPTAFALFLHAADPAALARTCREAASRLADDADGQAWRALVERSKQESIPAEAARVGFVASTREAAVALLGECATLLARNPEAQTWSQGGLHFRDRASGPNSRIVALFPGQGSQYLEMGRSLCLNFAAVHDAFAQMDAVVAASGQSPVTGVVFPPPTFDANLRARHPAALVATDRAQPAIGAFSLGLYKLLERAGFRPDFVAGHSLGELMALCAAGVIGECDYLRLLAARGDAMARPPVAGIDAGTLLAISGHVDMVEAFIAGRPGVTVANRNSRTQLVVAGGREELETLKAELSGIGTTATLLNVSGAFHSHRVAHAQAPFAEVLEGVSFGSARIPVYANATGGRYPDTADAARELLARQIVSPVEFRRQIETIHADGGRVFVECGPGSVLTGLVGNILAGQPHDAVALNPSRTTDSDLQLRDAYVRLRVVGLDLGDLDPAQPLPDVQTTKRGLTVRLNGASYVSETTTAAFEEALSRAPETQMSDTPTKRVLEQTVTLTGDTSAHAHLRYLENQTDYAAKYYELMQRLYGLATNRDCPPAALAVFERGLGQFHEQQVMAQQVHTQFLQNQVEYSQRVLQAPVETAPPVVVRQIDMPVPPQLPAAVMAPVVISAPAPSAPLAPPAPAAPLEPAAAAPRPAAADEIAAILLQVISEKTGYPLETLDVSMDVDSDLGIDSLKRVEIMAALEGRLFTSLAGVNFEAFAALRTIAEIANYLAHASQGATVN